MLHLTPGISVEILVASIDQIELDVQVEVVEIVLL
jgi:hypothetical protein